MPQDMWHVPSHVAVTFQLCLQQAWEAGTMAGKYRLLLLHGQRRLLLTVSRNNKTLGVLVTWIDFYSLRRSKLAFSSKVLPNPKPCFYVRFFPDATCSHTPKPTVSALVTVPVYTGKRRRFLTVNTPVLNCPLLLQHQHPQS